MGENGDAAGQRQDLVEILADHEHANPSCRRRKEPILHRRRRPHIEATHGRVDDEDGELTLELPRQDELLGIAAGEQARLGVRHASGDLVVLDRMRRAPRASNSA